jgi:hypothetical protein
MIANLIHMYMTERERERGQEDPKNGPRTCRINAAKM